jgi:hypothetical protein
MQTNQHIKNLKKSHELRLIRPQTQHKTPEHIFKFLTPSVEKIVIFTGSSKFKNQKMKCRVTEIIKHTQKIQYVHRTIY